MTGGELPIAVDRLLGSTDLTHDETYRLLADEHTRETLAILFERESDTIDGIVEDVTDRLDATGGAEGTGTVRLTLVHVVLPKLAAHDLLTYDQDEGVVSATVPDGNTGGPTESIASPGRP